MPFALPAGRRYRFLAAPDGSVRFARARPRRASFCWRYSGRSYELPTGLVLLRGLRRGSSAAVGAGLAIAAGPQPGGLVLSALRRHSGGECRFGRAKRGIGRVTHRVRTVTCIVVHNIHTVRAFDHLCRILGREWVDRWNYSEVRYRAAADADPEAERAALALAGFQSTIETLPGPTVEDGR